VNSSVSKIRADKPRSARDSLIHSAKRSFYPSKQSRNRSIPTLASSSEIGVNQDVQAVGEQFQFGSTPQGRKRRKKRLVGARVTKAERIPLVSPVEMNEAPDQVALVDGLSARCTMKPLVLSQESSTRLVPGTARIASKGRTKTVKLLVVVMLPCGVSMVMGPVVASDGTVAVRVKSRKAALVA